MADVRHLLAVVLPRSILGMDGENLSRDRGSLLTHAGLLNRVRIKS